MDHSICKCDVIALDSDISILKVSSCLDWGSCFQFVAVFSEENCENATFHPGCFLFTYWLPVRCDRGAMNDEACATADDSFQDTNKWINVKNTKICAAYKVSTERKNMTHTWKIFEAL